MVAKSHAFIDATGVAVVLHDMKKGHLVALQLQTNERFDEAMHADPFNLNPDLLYPIIDATTVKRTRHFVKKPQ